MAVIGCCFTKKLWQVLSGMKFPWPICGNQAYLVNFLSELYMFVFVYAGTWKEQLDNLFATKLKTINSNQVLQSHLFSHVGLQTPLAGRKLFFRPHK